MQKVSGPEGVPGVGKRNLSPGKTRPSFPKVFQDLCDVRGTPFPQTDVRITPNQKTVYSALSVSLHELRGGAT